MAPSPLRLAATLAERRREFGSGYAARSGALFFVARTPGMGPLSRRLHDRLLAIEAERGVVGPAHLAVAGNTVEDNRRTWNTYDWSGRGEEWNESDEWKRSLVEHVLLPRIPAGGTVLEIGPGGGRWTEVLVPRAERTILVDVAERPLELCRERFGADRVECRLSGGSELPGVADASIAAVWSFDAFVHIRPDQIAGYLAEIARVLHPGAVAVIHHAGKRRAEGWRSAMSAPLFAGLARQAGLEVVEQLDSWDGGRFSVHHHGDVITELRRPPPAN